MSETIVINDFSADYEKARSYVKTLLKKNRIAKTVIAETTLLLETLLEQIFEQHKEDDNKLNIMLSGENRMGDIMLRLSFEGEMFIPEKKVDDDVSPEMKILSAYADKIDYSYRMGYNQILITVRRGSLGTMLPCMAAMLLAAVLCVPLRLVMSPQQSNTLLRNFIFPLETLFTNAMLMLAAPVTFLSFLKNMTDTYIISEKHSVTRKLQLSAMASSLIMIVLAIMISIGVGAILESRSTLYIHSSSLELEITPAEFISSLLPSDIFAPFQTISPFPLFIFAMIVTYALCSSGRSFDRMKTAIDICFSLMSRMLSIVMYTLPFFVFTAFMDIFLTNGLRILSLVVQFAIIVFFSLCLIIAFYSLRLFRAKVKIRDFYGKLMPLLYENWKIGSAIEAAPFNVRYCTRELGIERKKLESMIPVLAQINLDGNCFFITMSTLVFIYAGNERINLAGIFMVSALVFFLSLGAPNQPGSCLIGMTVLMSYMGSQDLISFAIFCEMFLGSLQNITNIAGDIVTIMEFKDMA